MGPCTDVLGAALYTFAGVQGPPAGGAAELAVLMHGRGTLRVVPGLGEESSFADNGGRLRIFVRAGLHPRRANFAIASTLSRVFLHYMGLWTPEGQAELAAWLVAPTNEVRRIGPDVQAVADTFAITETCATLRVCEAGLAEGLVVLPTRIYRRGRALSWIGDDDARALARCPRPSHLRRIEISDEPGRVALLKVA